MAQSTQGRVSREAEARIEEVLLTPRVLDRRSYEELSGTLRALIREAVGQSDALRVSTKDIKSLGDSVRTVTGDLRQSLEKATTLAPKIESQIRRAEQVLAGAIDEASLTEDLESRVEALIRRKLETLDARLDEVFDRVQSRGLDAERLAEQRALQLYEALATKVDDAEHRIDGLGEDVGNVLKAVQDKYVQQIERHADRVRKQVEEADRKLSTFDEEVDEKLSKGCERLDATMKTIDDRLGSMNESIERESMALSDRVDARIADLEAQLEPVQRVISTQVEEATAKVDGLLSAAESRGSELAEASDWIESRVTSVREEIEKISGPQLRVMRDLTRRVETLMEDERVARLGEDLERLAERSATLEMSRQQADETKRLLADEISRAASHADDLEALQQRIDELTDPEALRRKLDAQAGNLSTRVEETVDLCRRTEATLEQQVEHLRSMIEQPMRQLAMQFEQAGTWLGQLIQQAQEAGHDAERAMERYRALAERIEIASRRHVEGEPSLDDVVGRVRAQLGDELAEVSKKLEGIVERRTPMNAATKKTAKKRTTKKASPDEPTSEG